MSLLFEPVYTDGIAQISYVIGDTDAGIAAVIDPRRDIEVYLDCARANGVRLAYAIETHIHADYVSGVHELAERAGARIAGPVSDDYGFERRLLRAGERLELGATSLEVLHTPGHTPEHISLLLRDEMQGEAPFGVFTGDTLFNLDVGRPDLLGEEQTRALARQLYSSLFETLVPLGDRIEVYPCHGAGSACGKSIGDRRQSTIGNERVFSDALEPRDEDGFVEWLLQDMPEPPRHYARIKKLNGQGAPLGGGAPIPPPLAPDAFRDAAEDAQVVDVRSILAFGGGHVEGAINIALRDPFANWAGRMLDADRPVLLVAEKAQDAYQAALHLHRIGIDDVAGFLRNGMTDWQNAGLPLERIDQWTVHELDRRRLEQDVLVLDVRSDAEVAKGRVPGARHVFVAHLEQQLEELDREKTIAVYCGTGYRASIAASLLRRHGFAHVANVPGSWTAWQAAGLVV
ncbi:rhodanese-like domain-containing protein [Luteimonas sp. MJ250]|uniref:MBL fold metallo-hydrolase n=1 Tax=Luteimonas sp. MJ250 TaxID=3129236 RepID=UPI0031BA6114